jgi:signal peptidase II
MFKFHAYWPEWIPYLGEREVFPAIWNIADGAITLGVVIIFIRQKKYFSQPVKADEGTLSSSVDEDEVD